jgi:hypothetical protein
MFKVSKKGENKMPKFVVFRKKGNRKETLRTTKSASYAGKELRRIQKLNPGKTILIRYTGRRKTYG